MGFINTIADLLIAIGQGTGLNFVTEWGHEIKSYLFKVSSAKSKVEDSKMRMNDVKNQAKKLRKTKKKSEEKKAS